VPGIFSHSPVKYVTGADHSGELLVYVLIPSKGISMATIMRKWTDEERLEYRKWAHRVAFCYGLAACLLFGAIAMNMTTTGAMDRTTLASIVP